jgi:Domain of unknown function (DUF4833)
MFGPLIWLLLQSQQPLFTIARSTNANLVQYDARLTTAGGFDPKTPVVAYWIMQAENGRYAELSTIEKRMAYGFTLKPDNTPNCYSMTLAADKDRVIRICAEGAQVRAEMSIGGRRAVLRKMFINTKRVGFWRGVNFIELFGTDPENGEQRYEKIQPK